MAGIIGYETTDVEFEIVTFASEELNEYTEVDYDPTVYELKNTLQLYGSFNDWREHSSNRWQIKGELSPSFFQDYYFRIHCIPIEIDLSLISTDQTRYFYIWNAYPYNSVNLYDISITDSDGITITGQSAPYTIPPLQELEYQVDIEAIGKPSVLTEIAFDFSDYPDPIPLIITGTRIKKFDVVPEVPVEETWEFLTDVIVSTDGTEQRIALRGENPRIEEKINVIFDNIIEMNEFYANLLICKGIIWIPEFQYSTIISSESYIGNDSVYFDISQTDIREGEFVLIVDGDSKNVIEVLSLESYGIKTNVLTFDIAKGSIVIPGSSVVIDDSVQLNRQKVNNVSTLTLNCKLLRQRESLQRPNTTYSFTEFLSLPIIDDRSFIDEEAADSTYQGLSILDNTTGLLGNVTRWEYTKLQTEKQFKINRKLDYSKFDYWKAFFSYCKGQCKQFWMPTYRDDLKIYQNPGDSSSSMYVVGIDYARKTYTIPTHRYLEIETAGGIHRCSVTSANDVDTTSLIYFDPALPSGEEWTDIKRISFLLPVRLADDVVKWNHYHLESILKFSVRTDEI